MSQLVKCENLTKKYGDKLALDNISLEIESGQIVGLLGPNGSGKTTLIKLLNGLLSRNAGEISIGGHPVGMESKAIVSYLPERTYFPKHIRVREAVALFEDFYRDFHRDRAVEMLADLGIEMDMRFRNMSKGTREKLQLVLVMSRDAKLYLLDEPIGGVDPAARDYIMKTILSNYQEDAGIIISTHLISDVEKILDDIIFLKDGKVKLHQKADDLRMEQNKSIDQLFREVFAC